MTRHGRGLRPQERLEQSQWDMFWRDPDVRLMDRPELLYIRCARPLGFFNVATRVRAPARRIPTLVDEVAAAHEGGPSRFMVMPGSRTPILRQALLGADYTRSFVCDGCVTRADRAAGLRAGRHRVRRVSDLSGLRAALGVLEEVFGGMSTQDPAVLTGWLAACADPRGRVHRFVAYDAHDTPVATGGLNLYPRLGLGFLWGGGTVPDHRGKGAYRSILVARARFLAARGLPFVGLYAKVGTSSPIVRALGFERHGIMEMYGRDGSRTG